MLMFVTQQLHTNCFLGFRVLPKADWSERKRIGRNHSDVHGGTKAREKRQSEQL